MRGFILVLTLALFLAGCSSPAPSKEPTVMTADPAPPEATQVDLLDLPFGWGVGVGVPVTEGYAHVLVSEDSGALSLKTPTTITSQATWSCTVGPCEIAMVLTQAGTVLAESSGPSPLEFTVELAPGSYQIQMVDRSPNQSVEGKLLVTAA